MVPELHMFLLLKTSLALMSSFFLMKVFFQSYDNIPKFFPLKGFPACQAMKGSLSPLSLSLSSHGALCQENGNMSRTQKKLAKENSSPQEI